MTPAEIETWFWSARSKLRIQQTLPAGWWPNTSRIGNDGVTPLAYLFFMEAAAARCEGKKLTMAANAADGSVEKKTIHEHWLSPGRREHSPHEMLLDFSVHNWDAANPIQLTGEAEGGPYHGVGDSLTTADDYSWDFYKLLVVPSASRLFFARVGKTGEARIPERIEALADTLQGLIDWYAPALLRPHDELGGVIVPSRRSFATEARAFWLDRGRLRFQKLTPPADVNPNVADEDAADA